MTTVLEKLVRMKNIDDAKAEGERGVLKRSLKRIDLIK